MLASLVIVIKALERAGTVFADDEVQKEMKHDV